MSDSGWIQISFLVFSIVYAPFLPEISSCKHPALHSILVSRIKLCLSTYTRGNSINVERLRISQCDRHPEAVVIMKICAWLTTRRGYPGSESHVYDAQSAVLRQIAGLVQTCCLAGNTKYLTQIQILKSLSFADDTGPGS
jgi:hypothetical protein